MIRHISLALVTCTVVSACGSVSESRLNPLNWFGRSQSADAVVTPASQQAQNLVRQVTSFRAESVPDGAILSATGLPPRQGYFDGRLVQIQTEEAGVLSFEFQIEEPFTSTAIGPDRSRELVVGMFISEQTLSGVRLIRVSGQSNALTVRR